LDPDHPGSNVRSSATAEDLPNASFAGQQDTYLHIIGRSAVLDAVRRCWASLWTERAVVYRSTNGIDHRAVRIAVVIQQMIESRIAGVLFTANPVTGRRRQAVIDANPGLGEAVVSGAVNPDHFVVNTGTGEIVERRLGEKRIEVRSLAGGGTETIERRDKAEQACLSDSQVRALAKLGDQVERHFGRPQDTEWAIDADGRLWLTQARPITTLSRCRWGLRRAISACISALASRRGSTGQSRPWVWRPCGLWRLRPRDNSAYKWTIHWLVPRSMPKPASVSSPT
jgi:pyruvate,water dikinase